MNRKAQSEISIAILLALIVIIAILLIVLFVKWVSSSWCNQLFLVLIALDVTFLIGGIILSGSIESNGIKITVPLFVILIVAWFVLAKTGLCAVPIPSVTT